LPIGSSYRQFGNRGVRLMLVCHLRMYQGMYRVSLLCHGWTRNTEREQCRCLMRHLLFECAKESICRFTCRKVEDHAENARKWPKWRKSQPSPATILVNITLPSFWEELLSSDPRVSSLKWWKRSSLFTELLLDTKVNYVFSQYT